jgi:FAD/FMN-containing dehydrogenase
MGQFALSLVAKHYPQQRVPLWQDAPYCVLLENSDHESESHARMQFESLLETAFDNGCVLDAVVAENLSQASQLWHVRESIPLAQAEEGLNIKHDVSIAVSRIPEFVATTDALLQAAIPGVRLVNFGHLGDGNLHLNIYTPGRFNKDPAVLAAIEPFVYEWIAERRGSISAEHGLGVMKPAFLRMSKSESMIELMRGIKGLLDPKGILNPYKVLPPLSHS